MKKTSPIAEGFTVRLSGGITMRYVPRPPRTIARLTAILLILVGALPVHAIEPNTLPGGATVTLGAANFNLTGSKLDVVQTSAKLVTAWDSFANASNRPGAKGSSMAAKRATNGD